VECLCNSSTELAAGYETGPRLLAKHLRLPWQIKAIHQSVESTIHLSDWERVDVVSESWQRTVELDQSLAIFHYSRLIWSYEPKQWEWLSQKIAHESLARLYISTSAGLSYVERNDHYPSVSNRIHTETSQSLQITAAKSSVDLRVGFFDTGLNATRVVLRSGTRSRHRNFALGQTCVRCTW
jgi:UDP-galactopyranose mutase